MLLWGLLPLATAAQNPPDLDLYTTVAAEFTLTPDQQLVSEAQYGRAANARAALRRGADPNYLPENGQTALYSACARGELELARELLAAGADVNRGDSRGSQPIHAAARQSDPALLALLLRHGADPNAPGNWSPPLHAAAAADSVPCAAVLLEAGANVNGRRAAGLTPLHEVAMFSNQREGGGLALATLLLAYGADTGLTADLSQSGVTPVHIAALTGKPGLLSLLVNNGADVNVTNGFSNTPLHLAGKWANRPAIAELRALGARVDDIYLAATTNDAALAVRLLAAGQAAYVDWEGEPPLCWAVRNGSSAVVRVLLDAPQQAGLTQDDLDRGLILAAREDDVQAAGWLLDSGASLTAVNKTGDPVLHNTLNLQMLELLSARGADLSSFDRRGMTALHRAAGHGRLATLDWLLAQGLPLDLPATDGATPLMSAIDALNWNADSLPAINRLVELGADVNARDVRGFTPLHRLAKIIDSHVPQAQLAAAKLLAEAGAAVNALNDAGYSVADVSCGDGFCGTGISFEMLEYLHAVGARTTEQRKDRAAWQEYYREELLGMQ